MSNSPDSSPPSAVPREHHRPDEFRVFRDFFATLVRPEFRPILGSVIVVLAVGTVAFHHLEHWSYVDSLYFCVVTLATIGYGDLTPTTTTAKLFSIIYVIGGVGILGVFISAVARASMQRTLERRERHVDRNIANQEKHLEHEL